MDGVSSLALSSDAVFNRITKALDDLTSLVGCLIAENVACSSQTLGRSPISRGNTTLGRSKPLLSPLRPSRSAANTPLSAITPVISNDNKHKVIMLLEGIREDINKLYSQVGQGSWSDSSSPSSQTRPPTCASEVKKTRHIPRLRQLFPRNSSFSRRPSDEFTHSPEFGAEERVSLEPNGTSWTWGVVDHEKEWECSVADFVTVEDDDKHVEFRIVTRMSNTLYARHSNLSGGETSLIMNQSTHGFQEKSVSHRFNDFKQLFKMLKPAYPFLCIPPLPPNRVDKLSEKVSNYRKGRLELWLGYFSRHPILCKDHSIQAFVLHNGMKWAAAGNSKVSEVSITSRVNSPGASLVRYDILERKDEIKRSTKKLQKVIKAMRELFASERTAIVEGLSGIFAHYSTKLKDIPSLIVKNPEESYTLRLNDKFFTAAKVYTERAAHLHSNADHFDEIKSLLEEFSYMVYNLLKVAGPNKKQVETDGGNGKLFHSSSSSRRDSVVSSLQPDVAVLKALCLEAEFHWVLRNQTERLALKLADFCESQAKLLEEDAGLCRKAASAFRFMD